MPRKTYASETAAKAKYNKANYDSITFQVRKGKKDSYKAAAAAMGLSLASFLEQSADYFAQQAGIDMSGFPEKQPLYPTISK